MARFRWLDQDVRRGQPPNVIEEGSNAEGPSRLFVPEGTEGEGLPDPRIFGNRGSRGDGGRGDEASERGGGSYPPPGVHPLAPREPDPFDPATEPSLVKISEELATAELELRHFRIKTQGQPAESGPTAAEGIPDAEKEISRLEQEYEAEAGRVREAKEGGVRPLAPTAQGSEQLPSAGKFAEGTATEAPKSIAIVRDLQKVLHEALEGVKLAEGRIPKRGIFARALAVVDPRAQVVRSVSLSDVPAIGHEYGHLMQKLLFGATAKGGIDNAQLANLPGAVRGELEDLAKGISDESLRSRTASPTPSKHRGAYDRSGDYGRCSLPIRSPPAR